VRIPSWLLLVAVGIMLVVGAVMLGRSIESAEQQAKEQQDQRTIALCRQVVKDAK